MKIYSKIAFFCSCFFLFAIPSQSIATVYEYQFTPPASIDPDGFAHYKIYIPDNMDTIQGIYCYLPGWQGNSLDIVDDLYYREYAAEKNMALMGFNMLGAYTNYYLGISLWSGEALITALEELSVLSGHPEIEYSALLFDGWSAGGQFAYHFTQWKPERVIAFVTMKGGYHSLSPAGEAINVPGYLYIGENDLDYRITNLTTIFEANRPSGALWALAMEPDAGHERVNYEIIHFYFDQIIPMRVPGEIPLDTIPTLIEIEEETGWLGDRETYVIDYFPDFTGDKTKACWFPNESIAEEWQNFVQGIPVANIGFTNQPLPEQTILYQNDPNPFSISTRIKYDLERSNRVTLIIYDHSGQYTETLIDEFQARGEYELNWQAKGLPGGIYFYQLHAGGYLETKKLVLQK